MTPDYYNKVYKGIKLDPYRIAEIYGITDHAMFQALKKLLVAGQRGNKSVEQDITEARDALNRKIEMLSEDYSNGEQIFAVKPITGPKITNYKDTSGMGVLNEI